jgi:hypothetical protein
MVISAAPSLPCSYSSSHSSAPYDGWSGAAGAAELLLVNRCGLLQSNTTRVHSVVPSGADHRARQAQPRRTCTHQPGCDTLHCQATHEAQDAERSDGASDPAEKAPKPTKQGRLASEEYERQPENVTRDIYTMSTLNHRFCCLVVVVCAEYSRRSREKKNDSVVERRSAADCRVSEAIVSTHTIQTTILLTHTNCLSRTL